MADKAFSTITWERRGPVAVCTLNRPDRRNGIIGPMMVELYDALKDAAADESLRILLLTGAGRDFCPGADLKAFAAGEGGVTPQHTYELTTLLHDMPAVTIAAIRGACAGAGLGWAAACDLRIASDTARFNTAFLDVGMSGDMGGPWTLPRLVGAAKARELYFLPGKFDAAEAYRIGLVNRMVPDDRFEAEVQGVIDTLASKPAATLTTMKGNFLAAERMSLADYIPYESDRHARGAAGGGFAERSAAFVNKRSDA